MPCLLLLYPYNIHYLLQLLILVWRGTSRPSYSSNLEYSLMTSSSTQFPSFMRIQEKITLTVEHLTPPIYQNHWENFVNILYFPHVKLNLMNRNLASIYSPSHKQHTHMICSLWLQSSVVIKSHHTYCKHGGGVYRMRCERAVRALERLPWSKQGKLRYQIHSPREQLTLRNEKQLVAATQYEIAIGFRSMKHHSKR